MNKKKFLLVIPLLVAGQLLVAQVDPATLNLGPNLLENPGFETTEGKTLPLLVNTSNGNTIEGWTLLSANWLQTYYMAGGNSSPSIIHTGPGVDAALFDVGGNGELFAPYIEGEYAIRISGATPGGFYQVVEVTPGDYFISIDLGIAVPNENQVIREDGSLKITRNFDPGDPGDPGINFKDDVLLFEVPIPAEFPKCEVQQVFANNVVSGIFTVEDEELTEVRFLVDRPNWPAPSASPLYLYDNCRFQKILGGTGLTHPVSDDPVVSTRYYTVEGVEIANPPAENGIYIVRKTLQSGKVVAEKKLGIRN